VSETQWDAAQHAERIHWRKILGDPAKRDRLFRTLDYETQQPYIERLTDWIGLYRPAGVVLDIGCGPIGLGPFMRGVKLYGMDPLAEWFAAGEPAFVGVEYAALGYTRVVKGTAEGAAQAVAALGVRTDQIDVILCCNVLDHTANVADTVRGIAALGHLGTEALLAYDLRTLGTSLHPTLVDGEQVKTLMAEAGWERINYFTTAPVPWHVNESAGVRIEHYRRQTDLGFGWLLKRVKDRTCLSEERLQGLHWAVAEVNARGLSGDLVECGCYRGGSAAMLGMSDTRGRRLWVFDSFEGMPAPTGDDPPEAAKEAGTCRGDAGDVVAFLAAQGLRERCAIVKGLFRDTLAQPGLREIAVLHIDCDWYESTKQCLDALYDKVVSGGVIQFDDYGHWAGARKAVDEFLARRGIQATLKVLDYTGRQLWKP